MIPSRRWLSPQPSDPLALYAVEFRNGHFRVVTYRIPVELTEVAIKCICISHSSYHRAAQYSISRFKALLPCGWDTDVILPTTLSSWLASSSLKSYHGVNDTPGARYIYAVLVNGIFCSILARTSRSLPASVMSTAVPRSCIVSAYCRKLSATAKNLVNHSDLLQ